MTDKSLTPAETDTIIAELWGMAFDGNRTMRLMFDAIQDADIEMCEGKKHEAHLSLNEAALAIERIGIIMDKTGLRERIAKNANAHRQAEDYILEEVGRSSMLRESVNTDCGCGGFINFADYCDDCKKNLGLYEPTEAKE